MIRPYEALELETGKSPVGKALNPDCQCGDLVAVVIFDNHPDSLRLILQAGVDVADDDFFAVRRDKLISFVCALFWFPCAWPRCSGRPCHNRITAHSERLHECTERCASKVRGNGYP